jgi:Helix-turn-helix.
MFTSNIRELMDSKKLTVRDLASLTGMSSRTIQRAVSDESIHKCELGTLAKIGSALGVKTKRLYDEVEEQ